MGAGYELLTESSALTWVAARPELAARLDTGAATVLELSDGNLNLVFLIRDPAGRGLVVKQALPHVRVDPSWPMTPERSRHEAEALRAHGALSPEHVPELFAFDAEAHVLVIEDLSRLRVWRGALNDGLRHDGVAEELGRYVARVTFGTSVLGADAMSVKEATARSVNPQLCGITEDLVFTEPYVEHPHNAVLPGNERDVQDYTGDPDVLRRIGRAKLSFMTSAQALIHGDLHTGSVMVGNGEAKAFDSEFAFYGPIAFDLGVLHANYVLAAARAVALGRDDLSSWLLSLPASTHDAFDAEFRRLWPDRVDPRVFGDDVLEDLLGSLREEAAVYEAAELARRIVGFAKVSDIESLPPELREGAARGALRAAHALALEGTAVGPDRVHEVLSAATTSGRAHV